MDGHEAGHDAGPESSAAARRRRLVVMAGIGVLLLLLIGVREMGDGASSLPPAVVWTDAPNGPSRWREDPAREAEIELENGGGAWSGKWPPDGSQLTASWNLALAPDWLDRFRAWCGAASPIPECVYIFSGETRDVDGVRWFEFRR